MRSINRFAIVVTAREPCRAWARSCPDASFTDDEVDDAFASVYLIDECEPDRVIRRHYAKIFEEQLNSWHRDEAFWPPRRTEAMFRDWFEFRVVDMVLDVGRRPIEADE
ncbi:MAG: hypothetical protein U0791_14965 [Gemmataceae bacterium]